MARPFASSESAQKAFRSYLRQTTLAPRTVTFYCETIHSVLGFMDANGLHTLPHEITPEDVKSLLDCMARDHLAIATRKGYLSSLKKYLTFHRNNSMSKVSYKLPHDMRPKVDWLSSSQALRLLEYEHLTTIQKIVIHLELCLGLRRVEVIRIRPEDVHLNERYLDVRGKGPMGGKPRCIPFAPGTSDIVELAIARRNSQIEEAREWLRIHRRNTELQIPEQLVIWRKAGELHSYSEEGYGIDKVVSEPLSKVLGFQFSNHTLRRTFGRAMYRAGVPVATIARILGHESTEVTLRYIGVDLDDMRQAMTRELFA